MKPLSFPHAEVPRQPRPAGDAFQKLQRAAQPVVFTGCLEDWPLIAGLGARPGPRQKLAHLAELIGPREVKGTFLPTWESGYLAYREGTSQPTFAEERRSLPDLFQAIGDAVEGKTSGPVYMQSQPVAALSGLKDQLGLPAMVKPDRERETNLWVGSGGHVVTLHFDQYDNFICMLEGAKRVTLLPPEVLPDLSVGPLDRGPAGAPASLVRLLEPDFQKYPRFRRALQRAQVAVLRAGDLLWIPPLWWHHVESFHLNVMVNIWVHDLKYQLFVDFRRSLEQAIVLFGGIPADVRERVRWLYRWLVFRDESTQVTLDHALQGRLEAGQLERLTQHLFRCVALYDRLPPAWRAQMLVFFDHLAFQVEGDPIPTLPGAFREMIGRLEKLHA